MKDLSLHVLDLMQNSTVVGSTLITLDVEDSIKENIYRFTLKDNGKGMDEELLSKVTDPYTTSRTTRKVGLGLPLIKQNAEQCQGGFDIKSKLGVGTELSFWFKHDNIDRPPLGDLAGALVLTAAQNEGIRFIYTHKTDKDTYVFDTKEVVEALGMGLNDMEIIKILRQMIEANLLEIEANQ